MFTPRFRISGMLAILSLITVAGQRPIDRNVCSCSASCFGETKCKNSGGSQAIKESSVGHLYLGCFEDKPERALVHVTEDRFAMTIPTCLQECIATRFPIAGLEHGKDCFCGFETYDKYGRRPDSECNAECTGNKTTICGGKLRMSVYTVAPDLDECSLNSHNCHENATCTNTRGSFQCACKQGETGDGISTCVDINECKIPTLNSCHKNASCVNTPGSYICSCKKGYVGDGTNCRWNKEIDDCSSHVSDSCKTKEEGRNSSSLVSGVSSLQYYSPGGKNLVFTALLWVILVAHNEQPCF